MQQPPNFVDSKILYFVCKLNKGLLWYKTSSQSLVLALSSWLTTYGFSIPKVDPSLFIMHLASTCIFILIYVDDLIITSSSQQVVDQLITTLDHSFLVKSLDHSFLVKNLGRLAFFLGVELDYLSDGLLISQRKYILDLLKKTCTSSVNHISSSMAASTQLSKFDFPFFDNLTLFRNIVGSLQSLPP